MDPFVAVVKGFESNKINLVDDQAGRQVFR